MTSDCAVFCVGNVVADVALGPVNQLTEPGTIQMVDRAALVPGGNAVNTAIALARLGRRARLAGAVGDDRLGLLIREALGREGVDDANLVSLGSSTTSITVALIQQSGERRFLHLLGANGLFSDHHLNWELVEGCRFFHYASAFVLPAFDGAPLERAMARAKQLGARTSLDICWDTSGRGLALLGPVLPSTDLMFLNQGEGQQLTGEEEPATIASRLRSLGAGVVVVKLGVAGCHIAASDRAFSSPGFRVVPVDTTGAGDSFVAAFLSSLYEGATLEQAAVFANAAGALSTLGLGGSDSAPTRQQVEDFVRERGHALSFRVSNPEREVAEK